jgi:hypothetical protein
MFRDHLKSRLHLVPFFERKLALTPIQLDHRSGSTTTISTSTTTFDIFHCQSPERESSSKHWSRGCI